MSWDKCVVHMQLGGTSVTNPCASYVGKEVLQWDFDLDFLCYYILCEMVVEARQKESIHVYVEYEVDTLDVVDDTMWLPGSREKDVNSGVGAGEKILGMRGETMMNAPTKCTNKRKDKEIAGRA
ncbi:hypothetical protein GOBAR_AA26990 [Gossypium barbadense]|uniref:Uncharacterized protein n=1 Tax=Gossypium barbadense TaxID=3634 RepID=A0A2P5WRF4_GOSBA|nr:hypothetical protein GOBAR_AA26990 [Gossypium barbadense]